MTMEVCTRMLLSYARPTANEKKALATKRRGYGYVYPTWTPRAAPMRQGSTPTRRINAPNGFLHLASSPTLKAMGWFAYRESRAAKIYVEQLHRNNRRNPSPGKDGTPLAIGNNLAEPCYPMIADTPSAAPVERTAPAGGSQAKPLHSLVH